MDGTTATNEMAVHDWHELNDLLYADDWDESLRRYRSTRVFRGQADGRIDLRSDLALLGGGGEVETHLLRNFRKYALGEGTAPGSLWTWLALGQHHGLPTRLVDWTFSPHVALHFAVSEESLDRDAMVWCIDYRKTNAFLPPRLKELLEDEGSDVFTVEMLDQAAETLQE